LKTTGVRLHGANDLRLDQFELPELQDNELLMKVVSDSVCFSTYKAVLQGEKHKRVPPDIKEHPIVVGHEMCGEIAGVGSALQDQWQEGQRVVIQPALYLPDSAYSVGYSFPYFGGSMTYGIIPNLVIERGCVLPYTGSFFKGSLAEPICCILRAFKSQFHIHTTTYEFIPGLKEGGKVAIMGGAGPMGLGALDIALHCYNPSLVVVTDLDAQRLERAARIFTVEDAKQRGIELVYINVSEIADQESYLREVSGGGFDDIFVMVPSREVVEMADALAAKDCCINFFAGPADRNFQASINLYRLHYDTVHMIGTSGGSLDDLRESLKLIEEGTLNPASMVSHICGLDHAVEAVMDVATPGRMKTLCYADIKLPVTAISDFGELGRENELFRGLAQIVEANNGLLCDEAEEYLLQHGERI